jgi:hypothetical protein
VRVLVPNADAGQLRSQDIVTTHSTTWCETITRKRKHKWLDPYVTYRPGGDLGTILAGMPPARNERDLQMRNILWINLWHAAWTGRTDVIFSRSSKDYGPDHHYPPCFTRKRVRDTIDEFEAFGLIGVNRNSAPGRRPTMWLKEGNMFLGRMTVNEIGEVEHDPIEMRDDAKQRVVFLDTKDVIAMRRDLRAQNAMLRAARIELRAPGAYLDQAGFYRVGNGVLIDPTNVRLTRIFNCDWRHGGRAYRGWWQHISSELRQHIFIDGDPTIEEDFARCPPPTAERTHGHQAAG